MDIQINLRRGDFEAMHPTAKLLNFDAEKMVYFGDKSKSINSQWSTWCACIGMQYFEVEEAQKVAVPEGFVLVPKTNSDKGIESMAMRYRHDFPLLDADYQEGIKSQMRQLYEEAVGLGFYSHKAQEQVG